jgi:hypothetical protein
MSDLWLMGADRVARCRQSALKRHYTVHTYVACVCMYGGGYVASEDPDSRWSNGDKSALRDGRLICVLGSAMLRMAGVRMLVSRASIQRIVNTTGSSIRDLILPSYAPGTPSANPNRGQSTPRQEQELPSASASPRAGGFAIVK